MESIYHEGILIALIVSNSFADEGVTFFTPNNFSQQLAFMSHPKGTMIEPHRHNAVHREVVYTQEVLFIKKGALRVDFYDSACTYLESRILRAGDVILLASGGHGFEVLETLEMIEVKQGPFIGAVDKTRFPGTDPKNLCIREIHGEEKLK